MNVLDLQSNKSKILTKFPQLIFTQWEVHHFNSRFSDNIDDDTVTGGSITLSSGNE